MTDTPKPGRPFGTTRNPRTKAISIRLHQWELDELHKLASRAGAKSTSRWMVATLLKKTRYPEKRFPPTP